MTEFSIGTPRFLDPAIADIAAASGAVEVGTLSKAIPSVGGYVAGDAGLVGYLRHYSRPFIFSAALPPPQAAAALEALDVIEAEPWRVRRAHENAERLRRGLQAQGWDTGGSTTCVIPVLVGDDAKAFDLARELFARGLFVCPIGHPAVPKGQARLRLTVMATHTAEELDFALEAIGEAGAALGLLRREAAGA